MSPIEVVLIAKITVTGLFAAVPFVVFSADRISSTTGIPPDAAPLFRLYGIAVTALLVGYASGFWIIAQGQFPWGIAIMGLVSNGLGALTLFVTGFWRRFPSMTFFIASIAIALAFAMMLPTESLVPLSF